MTEALQSTSRIDASVIVCTYNRSASLKRTLRSLQAQVVGDGVDWEVLIVDNNSKDDTRSVVEGFGATFSRLRYCYEPTQGLSFARNHGLAQASGNILLFTDDDVTPEPDWLRRILDGMARSGCDACGGYIAPLWESPPPAWLTDRFHGFLAIKAERTDTYEIVDGLPLPFGANMAFRREVFARFGVFDVTRGRRGDILASGEDGELFARILAGGCKVMYFGNAQVHHAVEGFRLTKRYFRRWRYQTSRNLAQSRGFPGNRRVHGVPLYLYPQLLRAIGRAFVARFLDPADEAFYKEIIAWHFLGSIGGLWHSRKAPRSS
jgi:glycosyltransferase involved in cell wall biosynthesis